MLETDHHFNPKTVIKTASKVCRTSVCVDASLSSSHYHTTPHVWPTTSQTCELTLSINCFNSCNRATTLSTRILLSITVEGKIYFMELKTYFAQFVKQESLLAEQAQFD